MIRLDTHGDDVVADGRQVAVSPQSTVIRLDTHAWRWLCLEPRRLSTTAAAAIRRAVSGGGLAVASITHREGAMMMARGRVLPQGAPEAWLGVPIDRSGVTVSLPVCQGTPLERKLSARHARKAPTMRAAVR